MKRVLLVFGILSLAALTLWFFVRSPSGKIATVQTDFSKSQIKATQVADHIYLLAVDQAEAGQIAVSVGDDGILIVDDQFEELSPKIREALNTLSKSTIRFVINTHWHNDHSGSNVAFGREATIIAHENVRKRLSGEWKPEGRKPAPPIAREGLPIITFAESLSIHFNGEEIQLIHLPHGHTDGDTMVYFKSSKVVHLGDHFSPGCFPFIDVGGGGQIESFTRNIETIIKLIPEDTKIIPGHGRLSTVSDLKEFHQMLLETTSTVREGMNAGKNVDVLRNEGLPEKWQSWSCKADARAWITNIYRSLSHRSPASGS